MTKSKTTTVALVNGSLAVRGGAGKVKNITRKRHFFQSSAVRASSTQVLSGSQSPYGVGTQITENTMVFSISRLSTNAQAWVQQHDQYRITEVEVFATLASRSKNGGVDRNAPVEVYFYEDTDADSAVTTSWVRVSDRDNLGRVVLNAAYPSQKLISFKPTMCLSASSTGSLSPNNMIPSKNQFVDALAINQQFASLRVFSCCAQVDGSGQSYEYDLNFQIRYTVECRQPL